MDTKQIVERVTLIANIGVVLGLAVLIYEVNLSRQLAEVEATVGRFSQMEVAHTEYANSEHLPRIAVELQRGGIQSLTAEDLERLRYWEGAVKLRMASQFVQYQEGFLDQQHGEAVLAGAVARSKLWQELDVIKGFGSQFEAAVEAATKQ